jgi:hypothetical protein
LGHSFLKITKVAQSFGLLFPQQNLCINFGRKWLGFILCDF